MRGFGLKWSHVPAEIVTEPNGEPPAGGLKIPLTTKRFFAPLANVMTALPSMSSSSCPVWRNVPTLTQDGDGAHFGRRSAKIPARRVPEALTRLLTLFRDERQPDETALSFFKRVDLDRVNALLADLTTYSEADLQADDFKDIGSEAPFEMEVGEGECAT